MAKKGKSNFRILAEALATESLGELKLSKEHLNKRKLTIDEIKDLIREGFKSAKDSKDVKAKELEGGWGDAESENQVNWASALKLKEYFNLEEAACGDDCEGCENCEPKEED